MKRVVLAIAGFAAMACAQGAGYPESDRVGELSQMPDLGNGFYSGYLPITGT